MSKISHSNIALDNVIPHADDEELSVSEMMTEGYICIVCMHPYPEPYGYAKACEECGGDGILEQL